ncbi:hypothetical protein IAT40_005473 [Kwoniella sp. CBS 6097]
MSDFERPGTSSGRPETSSGRRTGTGSGRRRRPQTDRPETSASGIGPLPDQEFYREEDEDDYEGESQQSEEEEEGVFAFHRPVTAAVPGQGPLSDYTSSGGAPSTSGLPTTATTFSEGAYASTPGTILRDTPQSVSVGDTVPTPTGVIDVGGHLPELEYDKSNPPPFSGRYNPNNSSFAFTMSSAGPSSSSRPATSKSRRISTANSLIDRIQRRRRGADTASTTLTTTTDMSRISEDSGGSDAVQAYRL